MNFLSSRCFAVVTILLAFIASGDAIGQTIGPWTLDDMTKSNTVADDRPNKDSVEIAKTYTPLVDYRLFVGEKKALGFRVAPRNAKWAGILITTPEGKPMKREDMPKCTVTLKDAQAADGKEPQVSRFDALDTVMMYSDASAVFPKTEISVFKDKELLDRVTIDFTQWKLTPSTIQVKDLNENILDKGSVQPKGMDFLRDDGKKMFFWGGHENHIPTKAYADHYAETYREGGNNMQRLIGMSEMVGKDGKIIPAMLDRYLYLVHVLGKNGIYFFQSDMWHTSDTMINPELRQRKKEFWKELLTTVSPYTGKALKDDPTVIGFELSNETGLNERRFDYNRVGNPEVRHPRSPGQGMGRASAAVA